MKRRELEALKTKRDQLDVFDAYRAVAECLFAQHLAINNGYVFGPEQYRQWLLYSSYMNKIALVVCNMRRYYTERIIAAMEKQVANLERSLYYKIKLRTHVVHFLKLNNKERMVYIDKMLPLMITYRGSDFAEAFVNDVNVWINIINSKDELRDNGINADNVPAHLLARFCRFGLEDFREARGEREYRKAVKNTFKLLSK